MPCIDSYPSELDKANAKERRILRASLCAVLTVLRDTAQIDDVFSKVDWDDAGVTERALRTWWEKHQQQDAARKAREREERKQRKLRAGALAKLSKEELKALGLKKE